MLTGSVNSVKVVDMTITITASLNELEKIEQTKEYLENCLTQQGQAKETLELIEFYKNLSETEGIPLKTIIERLTCIGKKASDIKSLIDKCKLSSKSVEQAKYLIDIYNAFTDLVKSDWDYFPPTAIEALKDLQKDTEKSKYELTWGLRNSILLLFKRSSNGENLLSVYKKAAMNLGYAISEAVERDKEDAIDLEVARAAEKETDTISWDEIKRELNLP